jgi:hypothetical protein
MAGSQDSRFHRTTYKLLNTQSRLLFFSNLRTEEHRLRQAKALFLMRRTCNL